MNPDTTPTPRTDSAHSACDHDYGNVLDCSRELERELAEKTNKVARLRAEVQRAIEDRNRIGIEIRGEYLPKLKEQTNEVARLRAELVDRDKEWFQVIESFAGFHPVSITDALKQGIARSKKAKNEVAKLREENAKLRDALETYLQAGYKEARRLASIKAKAALAPAPEETQDGATYAWRCPNCLAMWEGNYIPKGFQCPQCNRAK